ncbi:tyrosine-type recombinase/integrase [Halobaculum sp. WSA2]|uniref:Tyrosine-type recombinase/integrase n=1 Tax=Halobaculum saliterrae TaxID=2073113 RepID=A0A6B0SQN0_9EURY|nr:site-specific integrase [Halobaculum saliterrae]MXR41244.1 tyrosine-type recombinase/integrase [Halobaculum saliterrae]
MPDLTDIHGFGEQFQNQLAKLEEADIDDADRKAIRAFTRYQDTQRDLATSTLVNNLSDLRLCAERADLPLVKMEREDVDELLFRYKHDRGLAKGTLRNYRKALKKFFRYQDCEWATEIEIGASPDREVDADKTLEEEEIDALRDAANHPRDKALLELLLDTGLRISAAGTLRVGDVHLDGRTGAITLNKEAVGRKGASGTRPLVWSKPYIANWLDVHPRSDDPDAPLFVSLKRPDDPQYGDGSLTYYRYQQILKELAEDAGVDGEKVNPHNFRKSAISRWIREGFSEQEIKHRAMWVKDSRQFETYSQVTDEEMNDQILGKYGMSDEGEDHSPKIENCPQCQTPLREDASFCPGCGLPLSQTAARDMEEAEDDLFADLADAQSPSDIGMLQDLRSVIKEHPGLLSD